MERSIWIREHLYGINLKRYVYISWYIFLCHKHHSFQAILNLMNYLYPTKLYWHDRINGGWLLNHFYYILQWWDQLKCTWIEICVLCALCTEHTLSVCVCVCVHSSFAICNHRSIKQYERKYHKGDHSMFYMDRFNCKTWDWRLDKGKRIHVDW